MKKNNRNKILNQDGEIVIESTIVMVVTIFIVFLLLNLLFAMYNQQLITTTANRTATDVASVYGNKAKDPFFGFMDDDDFENNSPYRYFLGSSLADKNKEKAIWYASYYLDKETLGNKQANMYSGITVTTGYNSLYQRVINVKIVEEYNMFTLNPLAIFKIEPKYTAASEASAVCIDPIHDMNQSKMYDEFYDLYMKSNKVTRIADYVAELILKLSGYMG